MRNSPSESKWVVRREDLVRKRVELRLRVCLQAMLRIVGRIFGCGGNVLGERMVLGMLESRSENGWSKYRIPKAGRCYKK